MLAVKQWKLYVEWSGSNSIYVGYVIARGLERYVPRCSIMGYLSRKGYIDCPARLMVIIYSNNADHSGSARTLRKIFTVAGPPGFEPGTSGSEGRRPILAGPRAQIP